MRRLRDLVLLLAATLPGHAQENRSFATPQLEAYFRSPHVALGEKQVQELRAGKAVAKTLKSRTPGEIFVFGAVYVKASPDAYIAYARDLERLRRISGYLALGSFSSSPQLSDLHGFTFDPGDVDALKKCKPGDCDVQMPESSMRMAQSAIDWSAPDADAKLNQLLQQTALKRLLAYQQSGNSALGVYNDKEDPTHVASQFQYILSYLQVLPEQLPEFYRYLLTYPRGKPANAEDWFYWAKVKFGLKPTLRIVHVVTMGQDTLHGREYVVAEKQLYASHYFRTALDLTFCIPEPLNHQRGFYLIRLMGSEQAGLTGFKGAIIRRVATRRSASTLQKGLAASKRELESSR